ncbi:carbohydrate kinase family protein [Nonomuraea sp. C10]|uniref:carbohydrate kinase family protein n=1 Tax=Nonomuraea sp. C10 TaxID=2600577 RepID=UPI0011CDD3EA|nr:carbohydrate kinase family protein [Nonomuraea sp. C10]TXK34295.1 carbohydrate kinase family protein [Nonomuraea sp. C10]
MIPADGERRFSLVAIGEIRIDVRVRVDSLRFRDVCGDQFHYAPVRITPAGVALQMARQAIGLFATVTLVSRIGRDEFADPVRAQVTAMGVTPRLTVVEGASTARVLVIRDTSEGHGVRLMVAEPLSDLQMLGVPDVRAAIREIAAADALFLTGYELLHARSAEAVLEAAAVARSHSTVICLDLVPHDIHRRIPPARLLPLLEAADVVVGELETLRGVVGAPEGGPELLFPLLDAVHKAAPVWMIRSGAGGASRSTIYQQDRLHVDYPTGYERVSDPMGFGDLLTARELRWLLSTGLAPASADGSSFRSVAMNRSRVSGSP